MQQLLLEHVHHNAKVVSILLFLYASFFKFALQFMDDVGVIVSSEPLLKEYNESFRVWLSADEVLVYKHSEKKGKYVVVEHIEDENPDKDSLSTQLEAATATTESIRDIIKSSLLVASVHTPTLATPRSAARRSVRYLHQVEDCR